MPRAGNGSLPAVVTKAYDVLLSLMVRLAHHERKSIRTRGPQNLFINYVGKFTRSHRFVLGERILRHDLRCDVNVTTMVTMNTVGIRELKSRLTHYVRLIKQGQNVIVTERGKPVAMLHGLEEQIQTREGRLARLATQGRIILPSTPRVRARRVRTKHPVGLAQAVLEDRAAD